MGDTLISEKEKNLLKSMVGKQFERFKCDAFIFSPTVFGIVGIYVDGQAYIITTSLKPVIRFYNNDEVACFEIKAAQEAEVVSRMEDGEMIETPIQEKIRNIMIVNDLQNLRNGDHTERFESTVGIIFQLQDDREVSFELGTWFSEMITVRRGYHLVDTYTPTTEFLDEWKDCGEYMPECRREVIML